MDEQQKYVEVEGNVDLVRETGSKAIINRIKMHMILQLNEQKMLKNREMNCEIQQER